MRLHHLTAPAVVVAALALAAPASAGEVTGNGGDTQGPAHANSICAFSGLEDGDDNDDGIPELPNGPGVAPQNWGHVQKFLKGELGLGPFEGRSWRGLHHHALMCRLAFAFLQHLRLRERGEKRRRAARAATSADAARGAPPHPGRADARAPALPALSAALHASPPALNLPE